MLKGGGGQEEEIGLFVVPGGVGGRGVIGDCLGLTVRHCRKPW